IIETIYKKGSEARDYRISSASFEEVKTPGTLVFKGTGTVCGGSRRIYLPGVLHFTRLVRGPLLTVIVPRELEEASSVAATVHEVSAARPIRLFLKAVRHPCLIAQSRRFYFGQSEHCRYFKIRQPPMRVNLTRETR